MLESPSSLDPWSDRAREDRGRRRRSASEARRSAWPSLVLAGALVLGLTGAARAQGLGAGPETSDQPSGPEEPTKPDTIADALGPAGDPGGYRAFLKGRGVEVGLTYTGEVLHNARGGLRRGSIYNGRLEAVLDLDVGRLAGRPDLGLAFRASGFQIHGRGLSEHYVGNLLTVSGIEALPATRLFELWLEKDLFGDKLKIRAGQLAADTEFLVSDTAGLFVNATFGWPAITAENLPSGGPAYPLATPGVRVSAKPTENLTLLGAVFNGDPAGPGPGDPQRNNRTGTEFRARDPAFLIGEAQFAYNQGAGAGLPGIVKLGGWHHGGRFDDQRFGADRLSLADPESSGLSRRLRGDNGLYAVLDQAVYRVPGSDNQRGINLFARISGSPSDRNLIEFYADGGLTFKGLVPSRPNDTFGIAAGYARISGRARGLDRDARRFALEGFDPEAGLDLGALPVRSSEAVIEVTYQAEIAKGWTVQPDFQYVFRPGGNVAVPGKEGAVLKDAVIVGLRTAIRY